MPKIKTGEVITWQEFFARWKKGIEGVTLLQQTRMNILSTWIVLTGIALGVIITTFSYKTLWWLLIILLGAFGNTIVIQIGNYQKYWMLKQMFDQTDEMKGGESNGF